MVSGLRVVVERDARSPVVAMVAVVGAGGTSDPAGKQGLAHLVEHLAFRSRLTGSASVKARMEAAGAGYSNGSTNLDYTTYETMAPKEALATLVKLEGQRLSAPIAGISPEVFAVEREVVRNELRQRNETGYVGQVSGWVHAATFATWGAYSESHFEGSLGDWGLHGGSSTGLDHVRVEMAGTAAHVGNMLAMLTEQLSTIRTSGNAVRFLSEQVLPWREVVDTRPEVVAHRKLMRALYATHPYGSEATGVQMAQVSKSEAQSWLEDVYRPGNTVVVVAGEFDVKEVEPLVHEYLGDWSQGTPQPVLVPPAPALPAASPRVSTLFTSRPGATQGQVQLACRLPTATPELEARYALMAELLEVKAYQETRTGTGTTYGFGASPWIARGGAAHLKVTGMLDAQRLEEGVVALRSTLVEFAKDVSPADLEQARSRVLAQQAVSFTTTEAWVDALLAARVKGFPVEAVAQRPAHLQAVTVDQLKQEFAGCLQRLVVSVTGDEAHSRAALQAVSVP
ncbi:M16 family metallopeptidase [Corallococcus soli]